MLVAAIEYGDSYQLSVAKSGGILLMAEKENFKSLQLPNTGGMLFLYLKFRKSETVIILEIFLSY